MRHFCTCGMGQIVPTFRAVVGCQCEWQVKYIAPAQHRLSLKDILFRQKWETLSEVIARVTQARTFIQSSQFHLAKFY